MESKLSSKKLSGVVKSYRKKAPNTSQYLKSRHLATISLNQNLKVVPKPETVEKSISKGPINGTANSRPTLPQVLPVIKAASLTRASLNPQRTKPKFSKWDFKGRLAYAEQELVICKNNLKNETSRGNELAEELAGLIEKEKLSKERAEGAVKLYNKLVEERDSLVCGTENFQEVATSLKKNVDDLNSELSQTLGRLKERKEKYENHDSKMSKLFNELGRIKEENSGHEETVRSLKNHNKELEIALNGIQDKRQEMIDVIQLLKGED